MQFIIRLRGVITEQGLNIIKKHANIIYRSDFLPIIGVQAKNSHILSRLDFVESIRPAEEGEYQEGEFLSTVIFEPSIKKSLLVNKQLLGWGDTRIFILDSGVNDISVVEHKDFSGTGTQDTKNHGTIVAKIIKHFAKGANLFSAKIGAIRPNEMYMLQAIEWAIQKGASIINISAGFKRKNTCTPDKCELCELVNIASDKGIAVVVAAGNEHQKPNSIQCPGHAMNAITVGAMDKNREIADYSSIGEPGVKKPNLVAPGNCYIDGSYHTGTSFATPVIAGTLGAILSRVGNIPKGMEYIYKTIDDLGLPHHCQGQGCLNLERLVEVICNETVDIKGERQDKGS